MPQQIPIHYYQEHYYYHFGSAYPLNTDTVSIRYNINYGNITIDNELITSTIVPEPDRLLTQSGKDYVNSVEKLNEFLSPYVMVYGDAKRKTGYVRNIS